MVNVYATLYDSLGQFGINKVTVIVYSRASVGSFDCHSCLRPSINVIAVVEGETYAEYCFHGIDAL